MKDSNVSKLLFAYFILVFSIAVVAEETPYTIKDGKFDLYTYVGWKIYNLNCYGCHGIDASGSQHAPHLMESLKSMTKNEFITKVLTRYSLTIDSDNQIIGEDRMKLRQAIVDDILRQERAAAGVVVMPTWSKSPYVEPHIDDLYRYLKARSDGVLGVGEPLVIEEE